LEALAIEKEFKLEGIEVATLPDSKGIQNRAATIIDDLKLLVKEYNQKTLLNETSKPKKPVKSGKAEHFRPADLQTSIKAALQTGSELTVFTVADLHLFAPSRLENQALPRINVYLIALIQGDAPSKSKKPTKSTATLEDSSPTDDDNDTPLPKKNPKSAFRKYLKNAIQGKVLSDQDF
jgi:hypothetical protein